MLNIPAGWKPISSAPKDGSLILLGCPDEGPDGRPALCLPGHWLKGWGDAPDEKGQDDGWVAVTFNDFFPGRSFGNPDYMYEGSQPTHWMPLPAAPGSPAPSAPGDAQDEDDSIALDKLADYIADTWPDKKYGLEEICQRLHAMWPGEFLSAADLEKNDPNVREALRALLLWWNRFQASDGDPKDACELLVKGARSAWQFAEVEIDRVPVPAPAAGDALDAARWRSFRKAITQRDEEWLNRMDSALTAMGLDPEGDQLPSDEQVDAAADLARQHKGDA